MERHDHTTGHDQQKLLRNPDIGSLRLLRPESETGIEDHPAAQESSSTYIMASSPLREAHLIRLAFY